jgi:transposase
LALTIKSLQSAFETANTREAALRQERDNLKEQIHYLTKRDLYNIQ